MGECREGRCGEDEGGCGEVQREGQGMVSISNAVGHDCYVIFRIMRLGDLPKWIMTNHVKISAFVGLIREDNKGQMLSAVKCYQKST